MASVEFSMREMVGDEEKGSGAIVHDGGGLGLAKDGQSALQIGAPVAAVTRREIQLYIIIGGGDVPEDFTGSLGKRRAPEIGVNDNSGAVDHRLHTAGAQLVERGAHMTENRASVRNFAALTNLGKLAPDKIDNQRPRQISPARTGLFA